MPAFSLSARLILPWNPKKAGGWTMLSTWQSLHLLLPKTMFHNATSLKLQTNFTEIADQIH